MNCAVQKETRPCLKEVKHFIFSHYLLCVSERVFRLIKIPYFFYTYFLHFAKLVLSINSPVWLHYKTSVFSDISLWKHTFENTSLLVFCPLISIHLLVLSRALVMPAGRNSAVYPTAATKKHYSSQTFIIIHSRWLPQYLKPFIIEVGLMSRTSCCVLKTAVWSCKTALYTIIAIATKVKNQM